MTKKSRIKSRTFKGSGIAEFAPALFVLLILIFFPMIDLIQMGVAYMSCNYINDQELIALANNLQVQTNAISGGGTPSYSSYSINNCVTRVNNLITYFNSSAFARLANLQPIPSITAATLSPSTLSYQTQQNAYYITITNTYTSNPFLFIPFFKGVPGIGAPVTYTISGNKPIETVISN